MAEALAKAVTEKLTSVAVGLYADYVVEELRAVKSAKKDLKQMQYTMEAICAVLEDAEDKGYSNNTISIWVRDLKSVVYDIDDVLDEVAYDAKLRKANEGHFTRQLRYYASSSNPIISRFDWSHKIKELREKLDYVVAKKDKLGLSERCHADHSSRDEVRDPFDGCAFVRQPSIIGRDEAKKDILDKLLAVGDDAELSVLPIVGIGGIGKTTLAKLVYADVHHFDLKLWACVSDKFQIRHIIEHILKDGSGDGTPNQDLNMLVKKLHVLLHDKKYFLVLDDVWVEDIVMWTKLKDLLAIGKAGSVVLITTRKANVASIARTRMEPYDLGRLPEHVCWSIFKGLAFSEGEEARYPRLCEISKSIVRKCCGVPLVVMTLGNLLRRERDDKEWQRISDMDSFLELNQQYDNVNHLLKISYDNLPSRLKSCFAHLSIYPKDIELYSCFATHLWSALGLLRARNEERKIEHFGYSCFMELVTRSLLQEPNFHVDKVVCLTKLHDLLHDLAVNTLGDELSVTTLDKQIVVSKFTRHIVWGYEGDKDSLDNKEFPEELLKARNARSFQFQHYEMKHISRSFLEGIISQLSCLRILSFAGNCFEELPGSIGNLKHLRYLDLSYNPILKTLPNTICKLLNLETLHVEWCEALEEIPKGVFQLQSLRFFGVTTWQMSLGENKLSYLHHLALTSCMRLESVWDSCDVGDLISSLQMLCIHNCPTLKYLPTSMKFLKLLDIEYCEELDIGFGECLQSLHRLQQLKINGLPMLKVIPDDFQSAASSLTHLVIKNCRQLVELPNCLQQFAWLQVLMIEECPHLTRRWAEFTGEDYPLIQHIPHIELDGVRFTGNPNTNSMNQKMQ